MIIYIHGFGSHGLGAKANMFRKFFKNKNRAFIAPSLSYIPNLALQTLEELIESYNGKVILIGSSLGGYLSIYLAKKYNIKAVLINPAIFPYETLATREGFQPHFYDYSKFEWTASHLLALQSYEVDNIAYDNFMLLVQKGDTVLDFKEAVSKFSHSHKFVEDGGTHSFEGIERYFEKILLFIDV